MNEIMKFEGSNVKIETVNGEVLFEIYSTGAALGYERPNKLGVFYPHKVRINKIISNAMVEPCVHGVHKYFTEDMLYDFMLEARSKKCRAFRKWVTSEVLPTLRKTGEYRLSNASNEQMLLIADKAKFYEEKATFFENRAKELEKQVNELVDNRPISELSLTMPYSDVKKNIKLFIKEFTEEQKNIKCACDAFYGAYQIVCRNRRIEPGCNRAMFDQIMHDLGYIKDNKCWAHIMLSTNKIKKYK